MSSPISNGLYGVPWGIGGGSAILQAEVARFFANLMLGGQEGVMGKDHLLPQQLSTPGAGIQLLPGGMSILNRSPGVANQTYLELASSAVTVSLDPTTGTTRTDIVMLRVEDPYVSGNPWTVPSSAANGPYCVPHVEYGVSSSVKTVTELGFNWSAIPICRITRPSSTSTILNSHITDLRVLVNPLNGIATTVNGLAAPIEFTNINVGAGTVAATTDKILQTTTVFTDWPIGNTWTVNVPTWATYMELDLQIHGAKVEVGDFFGEIRPVIAGTPQGSNFIDTNTPSTGGTNEDIWCGGEFYIAPSLRGTSVTIKTQAMSHGQPGVLKYYQYTYTRAHFKFKQVPGVA